MKIISINAGSSSLKFTLFSMEDENVIASGIFERIGIEGSFYTIKYSNEKIEEEVELRDHADAIRILNDRLIDLNIVSSLSEIKAVGHRIVHGKDKYKESVLITDEVVKDLEEFSVFAPIHNPANILGINACKEVLGDVPMVGVFDTAFHQTLDKYAYMYPVPYSWYEKYGVRKYGFHGTSHRYVSNFISEKLGRNDLRIIVCHLGSGGSIAAIKDGKCVDTTMGFTPLAGIMMGTRSGDIDSSIIPYIMEKEGLNASEVIDILNKKSGLLGVSEVSSDMRDILSGMNDGNEKCELAFQKYTRIVTNFIAQYYVLLGGVDVICFTAGVGERSIATRTKIIENLRPLGVRIDLEKSNVSAEFEKISDEASDVEVYVVPTDEELMIARDTLEILKKQQ